MYQICTCSHNNQWYESVQSTHTCIIRVLNLWSICFQLGPTLPKPGIILWDHSNWKHKFKGCCCCVVYPLPWPLLVWGVRSSRLWSTSFSVHLASSALNLAGSVHKSRVDNVVRTVGAVEEMMCVVCVCVLQRGYTIMQTYIKLHRL